MGKKRGENEKDKRKTKCKYHSKCAIQTINEWKNNTHFLVNIPTSNENLNNINLFLFFEVGVRFFPSVASAAFHPFVRSHKKNLYSTYKNT